MTYTRVNWYAPSASEGIVPKAKQMGDIDKALFDQDARIAVLEAALVALEARVTVLEQA